QDAGEQGAVVGGAEQGRIGGLQDFGDGGRIGGPGRPDRDRGEVPDRNHGAAPAVTFGAPGGTRSMTMIRTGSGPTTQPSCSWPTDSATSSPGPNTRSSPVSR